MKGLLLKDLLNLKQQLRTMLFILGIWLFIAIVSRDGSFFSGVMMIFILILPMNTMAYDEKAHWERFALTMPVSRWDIVLSKYLLSLICAVCGAVLSIIVSLLLGTPVTEALLTVLILLGGGFIITAIIYPVLFKLGVEKGRLLMMLVILIPVGLTFLLGYLGVHLPMGASLDDLVYILPVVIFLLFMGSILLSKRILNQREF
ncbi:MAG: ABC-2 transporter permease [Eubacterium aggregans]|jgi:ABC-2 type transport system permease protein|uniref:ABC-2 family transporter protein n=1 Tax=Eubacterium aggregans TaxID=81409 RepID=A0A1H3X6F0_9FIRM|nr:ABC-2 transporter permease [Eubacterium aggregans]MDD4692308.1 ABC-2 transporter permease [Eubacterium aggregans]MEA5074582.1 ABC-2 transporter permease [Eubacterium aggregans]SDZ94214.1 ABC-2 family transporter protein [Eubacterium aggregans]